MLRVYFLATIFDFVKILTKRSKFSMTMTNTALVERELFVEDLEETCLQQELTFGRSYRESKDADEFPSSIKPKHSPINVPFKLCRASQKPHKKKKKKLCKCSMKSYCTRQFTTDNISLLDRSALPQDKYMELLATPHKYGEMKKKRKKKAKICCKCQIEPCPPRLIQMAIPKKIRVLENWKDFEKVLPTEMLLRFDQILKSGDNLEPKDARYYFKELHRKKRKEIRRLKRICKRRREARKRGDRLWLKKEINETARAILCYIKNEPLFMLNFHQMMTSNELLKYLCRERVVKIKSRNCRCVYKKTIIEISDKLVKWMDTMNFFADIQPLDSKEKLLEVPSLESLLEEESEEEEELYSEEEEEEEEGERRSKAGEEEGMGISYGEGEEEGTSRLGLEQFMAKKLLDKGKLFGEEYEAGSILDFLGELDEDILDKLIQILSDSPDDLLDEEIDSDNLPGVTYGDVLEKLKEIRDGTLLEPERDKIFLEEKMVEWAKNNDPERVDDKVLDKIHETSTILLEWFKNVDISEFKKDKRPTHEGEEWGEEGGEMSEPVDETIEKTEDKGGDLARTPLIEEEEEGEEFREAIGGGEGEGEGEREGEEGKAEGEGEGEGEGERQGEGVEGEGFEDEDEGMEAQGFEGEEMEGEEEILKEAEGVVGGEEEGEEFIEEEEGKFEGGEAEFDGEEGAVEAEGEEVGEGEGEEAAIGEIPGELERLDSILGIIRGHKPSKVFEHEPGTICCLSLKIWAVWLLEIANNAHNWTKWIGDIIRQVRHYASVIRGDVTVASGEKKVLYKEEWRKFVKDTEEKIIAWRQYSKHVKDLSSEIMDNFHGKMVTCCPKCLQDHLIKNVVTAHETLQALTEAINCAGYWQRCLDKIVEQTSKITEIDIAPEAGDVTSLASEESYMIEIEELPRCTSEASYGSTYEIEELIASPKSRGSDYEIVEIQPSQKQASRFFELEEIPLPRTQPTEQKKESVKHEPNKNAKPRKPNLKKK